MKISRLKMKAWVIAGAICFWGLPGSSQLRAPENVPINFYGQIMDQNDSPVVDAEIQVELIVSNMSEEKADRTVIHLHSARDGTFALTGVSGYAIDKLSIKKEGFELSKKVRKSYVFGLNPNYLSSSNNPVIFRMWKMQAQEPLNEASWHGKVPCDGSTNFFDIMSGRRTGTGDLAIACTRTPLEYEPTNRQPYAYELQLSIPGGGVQPAADEFGYRAPERGYLPQIIIAKEPGDSQWRAGVDQEFYFKTAQGKYGRISVTWDAGHRPSPTVLKWNCSINPSGSRNLER